MKNLLSLLILGLFLTSCDKDESVNPKQDLSTSLNLKLTKLNSPDSKTYPIQLNEFTSKTSNWHDWYINDSVDVVKSIMFNTKLPTEKELKIEIWFRQVEATQLLRLSENATKVDHWQTHKEWDYISYKDETNYFYNNKADKRLSINDGTMMVGEDAIFEVVKTSEVKVDGESKTRVTIKLKGDLYPFYSDWSSPDNAQYRVEGEFSGIIE